MARASLRDVFRSLKFSFLPCSRIPYNFTKKFHLSSSSVAPQGINFVLQTCRSMTQLFQIQAHLITSSLFQNLILASQILKFSSDYGDIDYTILLFQHIDSPDTFCVNTVIKAYSSNSDSEQAVLFYFDMLQKGFLPNSYTFPPLVKSCENKSGSSKKATGEKCHGQAIKNGVADVLPVQNSLIHMYASFGLINSAWHLFEGLSTRDLVSWNSIINGYVKLGELGVAHRIFDEMPVKNVISWNIMISGYLKAGNPGCGLKLFRQMVKTGIKESERSVVSILTACGRSARLKEGKSVHGSLVKNFLNSSLILSTALIDMYSKCKRVECARIVFDSMSKRNLVCWNAMILGHCIHGSPKDGIKLFEEMVGENTEDPKICGRNNSKSQQAHERLILPDEITFIGILCACERSGSLLKGRVYFNQMIDVYNIKPTFAHYWCLANLYAGAGLLQEAVEILRNMNLPEGDGYEEKHDIWLSDESTLWGSLLGLCRFRGDVGLGEEIASCLIELEPDDSSWYLLLLNIYAAAGRWEDASKMKEMAKERRVRRIPSCNLSDLNEIVSECKLGHNSHHPGRIKVHALVDELAQRLRLSK